MELYQEIERLNKLLDKAVSELKRRGKEYANAYSTYRMLLAKELLRLRDEGIPATIAYDIARGKEEIAQAKENEIIAESLYKSCLEAINVYKIQINIVREQIQREYGNIK